MTVERVLPLRVGVVGLGWAGVTHLESYRALPGVQVVAIAGQEAEVASDLAHRLGVANVFATWEELLVGSSLDAISVCTPNALHHPIAIAALNAGIHVLCEKPMALDSRQASEMVAAAERADRVLQTVFNLRMRGDVQVLRRAIASGQLGRIYYAKASWLRRRAAYSMPAWFTRKASAGGGPLVDLGVHMLDLVLYLLDEPEVARASGAVYDELATAWIESQGGDPGTWGVEDLGTGMLRLVDGSTVMLEASWAVHGPVSEDDVTLLLHGSRGGARLAFRDDATGDTLRVYYDVAGEPAEVIPRVPRADGHREVVASFVRTIRGGAWAAHRGREGLERTRIIEALYASAARRQEVTMTEFPTI